MSQRKYPPLPHAEEIIERFGGIRPMAKKMELAVTTVQGWKKRGSIPARRYDQLLETARNHDIDIADLLNTGLIANENATTAKQKQEPQQPSTTQKQSLKAPSTSTSPIVQKSATQTSQTRYNEQISDLDTCLANIERRAVKKSVAINTALTLLAVSAVAILLWPSPKEDPNTVRNAVRVAALESNLQNLQNDLEGVQEKQGFFASLIPEDLNGQFEGLKQQASQIKEQAITLKDATVETVQTVQAVSQDVLFENAGSLEERMMKLQAHMGELTGSPVMAGLLDRVQDLRADLLGQDLLGQSSMELSSLLTGFSGISENGEDDITQALQEAQSQKDTALGGVLEGVPPQDLKAAALLLGMTQFRSVLNRDNEPFTDDMALLIKLVGQDNPELNASLERLAPQAEQGVLTPGGLTNEFKSMTGDIIISSLKGEDVSIKERANARINDLFQVEKNGELITGTPTQATLINTQRFLESGDLASAIAQMKTLEGPAAKTAAPWMEHAQNTLMAEQLKSLLTQSINLKAYGRAALTSSGGKSGGRLIHDKSTGIIILKKNDNPLSALGLPER